MGDQEYSFKTIGTGVKSVTTAGTAVQMQSTSTACRLVQVQARTANTGNIVVGDSNVVAAAGSERGIVLVPGAAAYFRIKNLNLLYLDAAVSGEGVSYIYFVD